MTLPKDFDFTQGNLQDYVDCPYRFYLRYILQTKWPALVVDDAVDFEQRSQTGARFHRLIQQFLSGVPQTRLDEIAVADPNPDVLNWWEDFQLHILPRLNGDRYVETILTTTLSGYRFLAKYDLILTDESNQYTIFDWKTSQKQVRKDWLLEKIQTRLYRFILCRAGSSFMAGSAIDPTQVRMIYWFAPHPETPISLPYSQSDYDADQTYFMGLIDEILHKTPESFSKTSNLKKCNYCVYRSHCDRGIQAGDLTDYDEFFTESEISELVSDFDNIAEIEF
jgi:hypothetical protein